MITLAQNWMPARSTVYAPNGAIATSQPLATAAGLLVLQRGGTAVDAAVTAAAVLNLVEPHNTGIGGDMFAILWLNGEQRLVGLNASGCAGEGMTVEALLARGHQRVPDAGVETVTVPGALSGWAALQQRYGSLSLSEVLQPAIELADQGFPVSPVVAAQWAAATEKLRADQGARTTFLVDRVRSPRAGEWFRNQDFARTLRLIGENGPGVLYGGELGRQIVDYIGELGGFLTVDDLRRHEVMWVDPISASFRGHRLWELPPNNQGIAALQMIRMLEPIELRSMGHNSADYLHYLIEAKKLAFADLERHIGDPQHMAVAPDALLDETFVRERRALLDPERAADRPYPGDLVTSSETIYLAAADTDGNMVSFINSVFDCFGSGVVVPGTGFALQNRGAGFLMEPGLANTVAPGKRPLHTLMPGFVTRSREDGREDPWLAFGVTGGSMQPQAQVQVMLNLLEFGMDLQEAGDAPRFRHLDGRRVALEGPVCDEVRAELERRGHVLVEENGVSFGGYQAVMRLPRGWAAASDSRRDGMAAGR